MSAYYNENDSRAAEWLRELIRNEHIAAGEVDTRSIVDVSAADLRGFSQCHFFAGIGGWSYALRLAGWADTRPVWTGSCPCQPFSAAARGRSARREDDRHLWPIWHRLIAECSPRIVIGEQIAQAGDWFDGVCNDMASLGYSIGAAILPACSVAFDHARARLFFVCHADSNSESISREHAEVAWLSRFKSEPERMVPANGISRDMVALSGFGNAIVPQVAAEFIKAYRDVTE